MDGVGGFRDPNVRSKGEVLLRSSIHHNNRDELSTPLAPCLSFLERVQCTSYRLRPKIGPIRPDLDDKNSWWVGECIRVCVIVRVWPLCPSKTTSVSCTGLQTWVSSPMWLPILDYIIYDVGPENRPRTPPPTFRVMYDGCKGEVLKESHLWIGKRNRT